MRIRYSSADYGRAVKKAFVYTREEHGIRRDFVDADALRIVERLKAHGHETFIVGGAVRDLMIGKKPKDFDIVTNATPSKIKRVFHNSRVIGRRFRLVHVFFGQKIFEVSTFRSLEDGTTSNTYGRAEEDVQRRDFSLNALFYDPQEETIVDYVGGVVDIRKKRMRPVIPLNLIFIDDPVRMLRAVKYATMANFKLPLMIKWKIKAQAALLGPISPSRLTEEILKIIKTGQAATIIAEMKRFGLFRYLQPNAHAAAENSVKFGSAYAISLVELDQMVGNREPKSGEMLYYLIRDYLEDAVDWRLPEGELFKTVLITARSFILPMNPPRIELENAVRLVFQDKGLMHKKHRAPDHRTRSIIETETATDLADPQTKKRHRRRRSRSQTGERTATDSETEEKRKGL